IELMFHATGRLNPFRRSINRISRSDFAVAPLIINLILICPRSAFGAGIKSGRYKCERPDLRPAPAVTRFIRPHPGAQKGGATNLGVAVRAAPQAKPLCQP